jgi:hypothetical protein
VAIAGGATPAAVAHVPTQVPPVPNLPIDVNPVPVPGAPIQLPAGTGLGPIELEGLRNARIFNPRT